MNGSNPAITRRHFVIWTGAVAGARFFPALAAEPTNIAPQPYFAGVKRALEALAKLGAPIGAADAASETIRCAEAYEMSLVIVALVKLRLMHERLPAQSFIRL
jgi:hypothetical protein